MTVQIRNAEMVDLLKADFQHRSEANFAWKSACSAHMAIPGLRGFWPMSAFDSNGDCYDQSGHGHTLTYNGSSIYGLQDLAPYIYFDGTGDYLNRTDEADLDITGTESYVYGQWWGVSLGGWFLADALGANQGLIGKWNAGGNQRSYAIRLNAAGNVLGQISDDGTNAAGHHDQVTSSNSINTGEWFFAAFTWTPDGTKDSMSIWLNETRTDGDPILNSIFNSSADFVIGGQHGGTALLTGHASMCWLSAMCITPDPTEDTLGFSLYQQVRRLFYV